MNKYEFLGLLICLVLAVGLAVLGGLLAELIIESDMPVWLKYILLK